MTGPAFRALAEAFVPEIAAATPAQWAAVESTVAGALAARPAALQRQVALFVRVLGVAARVRYGQGLPALDPARRSRLLDRFARSPLLLFRRGIWGLRTLVMMGWYTQPGVMDSIGYRATAAGWAARR